MTTIIRQNEAVRLRIKAYCEAHSLRTDRDILSQLESLEGKITHFKVEAACSAELLKTDWVLLSPDTCPDDLKDQESPPLWIACDDGVVEGKYCEWQDPSQDKCFYDTNTQQWCIGVTHWARKPWPKEPTDD